MNICNRGSIACWQLGFLFDCISATFKCWQGTFGRVPSSAQGLQNILQILGGEIVDPTVNTREIERLIRF
ncbi:hypothetical protein AMTR_s00090p00118260 [Amborella trichopoda]|uniref:Uncharacterized protein n=1 Tax=Amborella trichopoda TaxID=13333 RepID=W1P3Y1_AMBTC|nr:hypothetical protein AMTR_s00090p00118260 [Amborella trichopoda]